MMFDWNHYIELADELMKAKPDRLTDAAIRSAVSRMYYGVFCLTRDLLKKKGFDLPRSGQVHTLVRDALKRLNSNDSVKLAKMLSELHSHRKVADYETAITINKNQAVLIDYKKREALEHLSKL